MSREKKLPGSLKNSHAAILAQREAILAEQGEWSRLSQAEKIERLRLQQAASEAKAAETDRITSAKLEETLAAFRALASNVEPMTAQQSADYTWKSRVRPQLITLGLEDREVRRIAPDWNCAPQQRVFEQVRKICGCTGAVVALVGQRGAGKTTIAAQLMRERVEARFAKMFDDSLPMPLDAGRYAKLGALASQFKSLYADFGSIRAEELSAQLKQWFTLDLLVLDEIHESEDLKTQMRLLVDIVDSRYRRKKDTILISNHDAEAFRGEMNPSILSRISEHGAIIPCTWKSWRTGK